MAVINFLPVMSAVAPVRLKDLYGIDPASSDLVTLLQHRAILLGLVGLALATAAHMPSLRWPALIGGAISMGSFVLFAVARGLMSGPLGKIAMVDIVGLIFAVFAAFIMFQNKG